tara:strand:- start:173 stop:2053 length:1881 start_codon:yes stop_codon:yes gene_type:complete
MYGRNATINGLSRRVCMNQDCNKRVTGLRTNRNSNIKDYNYCAKHQPIDVLAYLAKNFRIPDNWLECDDNFKSFIEAHFKLEGLDINDNNNIYNFEVTNLKKYTGCHGILSKKWDIKLRIIDVFPEKKLRVIYYKILPKYILEGNVELQKEIIQDFFESKKLDFTVENIYKVKLQDLENHKSGSLFNYYNHSPYKLFNALYPELELIEYNFSGLKHHFVDEDGGLKKDNIKSWFMKEIYSKYKFPENSLEYDNIKHVLLLIRCKDIQKIKGSSFFGNKMNACAYTFINIIFPEHNIKFYELVRPPSIEYTTENIKKILEIFKNDNKLTSNKELYQHICVNKDDLCKYISYHRIHKLFYKSSTNGRYSCNATLLTMLNNCYPDECIEMIIEDSTTKLPTSMYNPRYNTGRNRIKKLLDTLFKQLHFNTKEDHYKIRYDHFRDSILVNVIDKYYKTYVNLLLDMHPENEYEVSNFKKNSFNYTVYILISEIFEELGLVINKSTFEYTFNDLRSICGNKLRFDLAIEFILKNDKYIWLFEKDGQQHFEPVRFFGGIEKFNTQRVNDISKNIFVKKQSKNISLFRISYKETNNIKTFKKTLKKMIKSVLGETTNRLIVSNEKLYKDMLNG